MRFLAGMLALFFVLCCGCGGSRPVRSSDEYSLSLGEKAAATAQTLMGRPYKYKGENPSGFDCSGLVRYSYRSAGMDVPHSTRSLKQQTRPVRARDIRKGDLLFFDQLGKKFSHVGIAIGNAQFVHAPSSGKSVRKDSLDDPYWREHFAGARRF